MFPPFAVIGRDKKARWGHESNEKKKTQKQKKKIVKKNKKKTKTKKNKKKQKKQKKTKKKQKRKKKTRQKNSASCRNDTRDQVGLCLFVCLALHNSLIQIRRGHGNRRRALTHTKEPRDTNVQKRKRKKKRWCAELPTLMSLIAYCLGLFVKSSHRKQPAREEISSERRGNKGGKKERSRWFATETDTGSSSRYFLLALFSSPILYILFSLHSTLNGPSSLL